MAKSSDMRGKVASRRREVEIARTREDILLAAARALGRRGFGSVSMQEIAADVGFTAPALYAYFTSKEEIFSALGAMLHNELAATFLPPPPEGLALRRRLSILLGRQLEWADRRRDVFLAFLAMRQRGETVAFGAARVMPRSEGPARSCARGRRGSRGVRAITPSSWAAATRTRPPACCSASATGSSCAGCSADRRPAWPTTPSVSSTSSFTACSARLQKVRAGSSRRAAVRRAHASGESQS